jgi:hypothetical protein
MSSKSYRAKEVSDKRFNKRISGKGGAALELKQQKVVFNQKHSESQKLWRKSLIPAKDSGVALIKAKAAHKKLHGHGSWQEWALKNFDGSPATRRTYMKLASEWNHPEIKEARKRGDITSLNTFLAFTAKAKAQQLQAMGPEAKEQTKEDELRKSVNATFSNRVERLEGKELEVLEEDAFVIWEDAVMREVKFGLLPEAIQEMRFRAIRYAKVYQRYIDKLNKKEEKRIMAFFKKSGRLLRESMKEDDQALRRGMGHIVARRQLKDPRKSANHNTTTTTRVDY